MKHEKKTEVQKYRDAIKSFSKVIKILQGNGEVFIEEIEAIKKEVVEHNAIIEYMHSEIKRIKADKV